MTRFFKPMSVIKFCLAVFLITVGIKAYGQKSDWQSMRASGANYYGIKAAFLKQHAAKLAEMKSGKPGANEEEEEESGFYDFLQFMRWADFVGPRVAESKGDLKLMNERHMKGVMQVNGGKQKMSQPGY